MRILIDERLNSPGVGAFTDVLKKLKAEPVAPSKHYILNKESQCRAGTKLVRVPASLVPEVLLSVEAAKHGFTINPNDEVTMCWGGGGEGLNIVGKFAQDAVTETFKVAINPKTLLDKIPGVNQLTRYIPDPTKLVENLAKAVADGDLSKIKSSVLEIGYQVANIAAMVPGVGNVVGGPLNAALTMIETGSVLKTALSFLLNEIPGIPPQIRDILRVALHAIADVVENQAAVTDILIVEFKKGVRDQAAKAGVSGPISDLIETVLDGAIQIIFEKKPLDEAALDLAQDGLNIAKKKALEGIGSLEAVQQAEGELSHLKKVYKAINAKQIGSKMPAAAREAIIKSPVPRPPTLTSKRPALTSKRPKTDLEKLAELSPEALNQLKQLAELKKLSPEEQRALASLSPHEQAQLASMSPEDVKRALAKPKTIEVKSTIPYAPYPAHVRAS